MRHWAEQYVGLPYADFDCAALCVKVMHEVFDREILFPDERPDSIRAISKTIDHGKADYGVLTDNPVEGDAVLMYGRGRINHIGIVCIINGQMFILHAMRNAGHTVLHPVHALKEVGLLVEGYYKWT